MIKIINNKCNNKCNEKYNDKCNDNRQEFTWRGVHTAQMVLPWRSRCGVMFLPPNAFTEDFGMATVGDGVILCLSKKNNVG